MQGMIPITMQVPADLLAKAMLDQLPVDRHRAMVERLGEACSKTTAAKEIECSTQTINRLLETGRLQPACEGKRIDVRSLCEYIERRAEIDHEVRMRKKYGGTLRV